MPSYGDTHALARAPWRWETPAAPEPPSRPQAADNAALTALRDFWGPLGYDIGYAADPRTHASGGWMAIDIYTAGAEALSAMSPAELDTVIGADWMRRHGCTP